MKTYQNITKWTFCLTKYQVVYHTRYILCLTKYQQGTYSICKAMVDLLLANCRHSKMMMVMIIVIAMMMKKTMIKSILMKHRWILALKSSLLSQKSFVRENSEAQQILNTSHLRVSCRSTWHWRSLGAKHFTFSHKRCSLAHIFSRVFAQLKFSYSSASLILPWSVGEVHNFSKLKIILALNFLRLLFLVAHISVPYKLTGLQMVSNPISSSHFLVMKADELRLSKYLSKFELCHIFL